jgi:hypothetical protein
MPRRLPGNGGLYFSIPFFKDLLNTAVTRVTTVLHADISLKQLLAIGEWESGASCLLTACYSKLLQHTNSQHMAFN